MLACCVLTAQNKKIVKQNNHSFIRTNIVFTSDWVQFFSYRMWRSSPAWRSSSCPRTIPRRTWRATCTSLTGIGWPWSTAQTWPWSESLSRMTYCCPVHWVFLCTVFLWPLESTGIVSAAIADSIFWPCMHSGRQLAAVEIEKPFHSSGQKNISGRRTLEKIYGLVNLAFSCCPLNPSEAHEWKIHRKTISEC